MKVLKRPIVCGIVGEEKTCKTTMALSFPRPAVHLELDPNGFARAAWRIDTTGVEVKKFPVKLTKTDMEAALGAGPSLRIKEISGMKEVWQKLMAEYSKALIRPEIASITYDTFTMTWSISHQSVLQDVQEKQKQEKPNISDSELREKLKPVEYTPANARMEKIMLLAQEYGKNLVLLHYPTDVYGVRAGKNGPEEYRTGETKMDGFKNVPKIADLVIETYTVLEPIDPSNIASTRVKVPKARIKTCGLEGLGIQAEGMVLSEPTYAGIADLVSLFKPDLVKEI